MYRFYFLCFLVLPVLLHAQDRPELEAVRIDETIKVDGLLDEAIWQEAPVGTDFTTIRPIPGQSASERTEVRVVYDNRGIYFGATLYDSKPDSILAELTERDDLGNTDYFTIILDPYQSGITGFNFTVTPANVQTDAKQYNGYDDENWDAVWVSGATRTVEGWSAEVFLPYSALRFPSTSEQEWTINFLRTIQRKNEDSFWAEVDPNVDGLLNQSGTLTGLYDIKAPLRLQATPFLAVYGQHGRDAGEPSELNAIITGGMDVKLGLNDAFTLDMTLVPDFGQVRSDNQILNLSPFEQRFDEQRAFFTEGTELFNKGGLFYSRRVGGLNYYQGRVGDQLLDGEEVIENPRRAPLYNATKISGRTARGTGVGFFNAIEQENYATIRSTEGKDREVLTNPLTNYNVVTVDQNLPNNSSVTLINTNVIREGEARDANVTGFLFDLHNKPNVYAVRGELKHSRQYEPGNDRNGHALDLQLARISGQWTWELGYGEESDTYDVNDLGILFANNSRYWRGEVDYSQPNAFFNGFFINGRTGLDLDYRRLFAPSRYTGVNVRGYVRATTRHFWDIYIGSRHDVGDQYDFFEPRVQGRFWRSPGYNNIGMFVGTDRRKKLRLRMDFGYDRYADDTRRNELDFSIGARYRFSNRFSMDTYVEQGMDRNDVGYVNQADILEQELTRTEVYFGTRNRNSVEAGLNAKYSFSANMTLNLRLRHYWSGVAYSKFSLLDDDGLLGPTDYVGSHDQDFDAFNVDLIYRWRFAPGSDMFVVYKGNISDLDDRKAEAYFDSLSELWGRDVPRSGSLSVKVVYWLDYASLFPK
ncbi:hypothetical protein LEM8419_00443 [Neolewinella maritima]|uniref:DUF5916 domain-containing protein n=1 Tax=Neolewinella maritima TaxID=1383882 RepID=A0ABN8F4Z9_9BACT|nr:DUF5916 domain-containing protein [Neolewinella maritima]CAH0999146.1 hypothetical protein LEM8419_00443 [Neolewinella maritima]